MDAGCTCRRVGSGIPISVNCNKEGWVSYTLRINRTSEQQGELFSRQKALEASAAVVGILDFDWNGEAVAEVHAAGEREHLLHELLLAANVDSDVTVHHLGRVTIRQQVVVALDNDKLCLDRTKLNVAVQGSSVAATHDDVNGDDLGAGMTLVWKQVAAKESCDFILRAREWDLRSQRLVNIS